MAAVIDIFLLLAFFDAADGLSLDRCGKPGMLDSTDFMESVWDDDDGNEEEDDEDVQEDMKEDNSLPLGL